MAGLQDIINKAGTINIDRRKVVGLQVTRNEIPRTSLTPTRNPWRFIIEMPPVLSWWDHRDLVEALDTLDRYSPQIVNFSNSCVSWIWRYQGALTQGQVNGLSVTGFSGTQITLSGLVAAGITGGTIMFLANDLIQIGANPYPFTVASTSVVATGANTITFTVNRPNFLSSGAWTNASITVGPNCNFNLFCPNMPTYKLVPGNQFRYQGTLINNARIEFSDTFTLYEWVGGAA